MRRSMIMLLAACLLGIGASPAVVAQSPSPSPDAVPLRVAMPEEGFTVTFPAGWVIEAVGGESYVLSPDRSTRCQPNGASIDEPVADPDALLDRVAAMFPVFSDDGPMPVIETSEIELPAGRAVRFIADFALDGDLVEGYDARYGTTYILTDGHTLLFFGCWGPERADDDWLSIARTIEFLPEEA